MRRIQQLTDAASAVCATLGVGPDRVDDVVATLDSQLPAFHDENRRPPSRPTSNPEITELRCSSCTRTQTLTGIADMAGWACEDSRWTCPNCFG